MMDILTEMEAKERRCPYSFGPPWSQDGGTVSAATAYGVAGPHSIALSPTNCIASQCMAWRLAHKDAADGTERGYCGAFGLPRFT